MGNQDRMPTGRRAAHPFCSKYGQVWRNGAILPIHITSEPTEQDFDGQQYVLQGFPFVPQGRTDGFLHSGAHYSGGQQHSCLSRIRQRSLKTGCGLGIPRWGTLVNKRSWRKSRMYHSGAQMIKPNNYKDLCEKVGQCWYIKLIAPDRSAAQAHKAQGVPTINLPSIIIVCTCSWYFWYALYCKFDGLRWYSKCLVLTTADQVSPPDNWLQTMAMITDTLETGFKQWQWQHTQYQLASSNGHDSTPWQLASSNGHDNTQPDNWLQTMAMITDTLATGFKQWPG